MALEVLMGLTGNTHSVGKTETGRDSDWPAAISEDRFALLKKKERIVLIEFGI